MRKIFTLLMALVMLPLVVWGQTTFPTDSWLDYADTDWYTNNQSATSYTITTAAELAGMAKLALWDKIRGCVEFDGKTITLDVEGGELDLSAHEWFPIGRSGSYNSKSVGVFKGTFDGKGCKIKGLYIDEVGDNVSCFGLFGRLDTNGDGTAEIKNIHIESGHIRAGYSVAGMCGYANGGTITDCSNAATIELHPDVTEITYLGGICGELSGGTTHKIENCSNTGNILATNESYTKDLRIGGICGYSSTGCGLTSCNNAGEIQAVIQSTGYIGGISGMSLGYVETCYNTGDILVRAIGSSDNSDYTGGIVGSYENGELSQSYNAGAITVTIENSKHWAECGGVVGSNIAGTIQSCYNVGALALLGDNSYYNNFGGVCGTLDGSSTIETCYNAGTMNAEVVSNLGGIVGYIWGADKITGNFNVGELKSSNSYLGAICGRELDDIDVSYSENVYLAVSGLHGYGVNVPKTGMQSMNSIRIVEAINKQLTSEKGWATTASYSASTLTLPKLSNNSEEEAPTVLVWEDIEAEISPEATDGWYGSEVTLKAPDGFTISLEENGTYTESVTCSEEGEHELTYYLKAESGAGTHEYTTTIKIDLTAPIVDVNTNYENYTLTLSDGEGSGIASLKIDGVEIDPSAWKEGIYSATGTEGEHSYSVTDKAGHVAEGSFTLTPEPEPEEPEEPVIPDYPDYYNIYVDECEGVTVLTSTNVVREGNSMTFTVEVAEGYTAEDMVVKVKRSLFGYTDVIKPNEEGKYEVRNIYSEIYITIEGVTEEETPTGIEELKSTAVYTQEGAIYVRTPQRATVSIVSLTGAIVKKAEQTGTQRYDLPRGIYIVDVAGQRYKVRN